MVRLEVPPVVGVRVVGVRVVGMRVVGMRVVGVRVRWSRNEAGSLNTATSGDRVYHTY